MDNRRFLYRYLAITFGVWWSIAAAYMAFSSALIPVVGKATLLAPIMIVVLYLPSIAGLLMYYQQGGKAAVKAIFAKLLLRRGDWRWLMVLFCVSLIFAVSMHYGAILLGIAVPKITYSAGEMVKITLINFVKEVGLLGGIFGWIGFLLPYWQARLRHNVTAAVITGLTFGLWVLPGYLIPSFGTTSSYPLYVLQLVAFIVFQSYIFNATRGNLLMYLVSFWLAATGSHLQLYYFTAPVQVLQIIFFSVAAGVTHYVFKRRAVETPIQAFPEYIWQK